ncbi:MAG TPA: TetR family transcriptional regulator C-terminal domain-containing protein [Alphaproteobacteria bacterium]|jgi:TetR/AcrR family transcriptional repressor of nem operon|nr:TetR family transcriptional regulator C-terminal domain-containing protein [Alphaproteobacteria bacterium]
MRSATKRRLIDAGLRMLLEQGYNSLGIQAVLDATNTPKGSFYHHFKDKEDFALKVIDAYIADVHAALDRCVQDRSRAPLDRVRHFFELTRQSYKMDGYLGCLMGGLGQELSGVSEVFRAKIEWCFSSIAGRLALCLEEAKQQGDIPAGCDIGQIANLLVDCWEGAALRSRLRRNPAPLTAMLDFYLRSVTVPKAPRSRRRGAPRRAT